MTTDMADGDWQERRVMATVGALADHAWAVIEPNLAGLTDDEYFWEPAADCWSVRRRAEKRSPDCWGKGEWVVEHCFDGSVEPAMTTIGWRLMHAYDCTNDFTSRAFGHGGIDWNEIDVAGTAAEAVELMTGAVERLRTHLATTADDTVLRGAGDHDDPRPRWVLLGKALHEAIHHTAEIGVLRQMFRCA
jgi:hypothetical protein